MALNPSLTVICVIYGNLSEALENLLEIMELTEVSQVLILENDRQVLKDQNLQTLSSRVEQPLIDKIKYKAESK